MSENQSLDKCGPKSLITKAKIEINLSLLPKGVENNFIKACLNTLTGFTKIPIAWAHSIERKIERRTEALDIITKSDAEAIALLNSKNNDYIQSLSNEYSLEDLHNLRKDINKRKILELTTSQLAIDPPKEDVKQEIDDDWLSQFSRIAETKSNEDVQIIFSKILAGEIKQPGSFSPITIQSLTSFNKQTAEDFIRVCQATSRVRYNNYKFNYTFLAIIEFMHYEYPRKGELGFSLIKRLENVGMVRSPLKSETVPSQHFTHVHSISGEVIELKLGQSINSGRLIASDHIELTPAGAELIEIIPLPRLDSKMRQMYLGFLKTRGGLVLRD
ncbi:DUF2806 domain-containing protein [uncultured Roseivirga sp.]|uniref:DUF2806 domain-containing protein n=1 Tax=uncultured Roseivirga sp. TaxID=543088 RepID=UPI0030DC9672|tara:strand:+ start:225824 stop:226813 length:990 start_codon:yes stop_codon:yes gene_type:complete